MRRLPILNLVIAAGLLLMPFSADALSVGNDKKAPPIAQPLVREGDFAVSLVDTLGIGSAENEEQAEDKLTSVGIEPKNGWIADYPMTPDIVGELHQAVVTAADSSKLSMSREDGENAFQKLVQEYQVPVRTEGSEAPAVLGDSTEYTPPTDSNQYYDPAELDDYYYDEGPPVVTYYPPPWDYNYLYSWVPYPFWWGGFGFTGFFILHDFHRFANVVVVNRFGRFNRFGVNRFGVNRFGVNRFGRISNHVSNARNGTTARVNAVTRSRGNAFATASNRTVSRGFTSTAARNGAQSIFRRSAERTGSGRLGNLATARGSSGRNFGGSSGSNSQRSFLTNNRPSTSGQAGRGGDRMSSSAPGRSGVNNRGTGSFNLPNGSQGRGRMNFERPSGSAGRSFGAPRGPSSFSGPSFRGPSGRSGGFSGGSSPGRLGSMGGNFGRGGFSGGGSRGGFGGHGGFSGRGFSGGGFSGSRGGGGRR